jgi:peroxiredoxin
MRLSSLSLIAAAVLSAAGFGFVLASRPKTAAELEPRHPITDQMRREAATRTDSAAPTIAAVDTEGDKVDLASLTRDGPAFLIFIMDSCPCSLEAQPFFQRLFEAFGERVPFIGITDGTEDQGREWKAHFQMTFPLISDPKKDLMKAFGAKHSAYSALIGKGGTILRLWPGYNQSILQDMKAAISNEAALPEPRLKIDDAPTKPTSGCAF